ncbi:glycosyltransferase family 4 protein, partial [Nitrolancea hollandica]|uniref:glycosyltransferase family 4 protein n=1 Tax=Nitrolancea hollandica TaxID=1206749 RepID=UPI0005904366
MARICIIRQGNFPLDPRVRREADALISAGHTVDIICLRKPGLPLFERDGRLSIRRLPLAKRRSSTARYIFEYLTFLSAAMVLSSVLHLRHRYDLIQVNSIPDFLVFAALGPRLLGCPVLLDLHECMPEFFGTKFQTGLRHPVVRVIAWLEQISIRFASYAITCTDQMRDVFVTRGTPPEKIEVILNGSDEEVFDATRFPQRGREPGRFVLVCHGTVEERYGLDTIIRAVALLKDEIPGLRLEIIGEGSFLEELRQLARDLGVEREVAFSGKFLPMEELLRAIASADAGVVAMKRDPFRDITLCNKMFDFIAMRKPALVSRTRSVEEYFDDTCFQMFRSDDEHDLAQAIRELHADPARGERLVQRAVQVSEAYRWPSQRERYRAIVERLIRPSTGDVSKTIGLHAQSGPHRHG